MRTLAALAAMFLASCSTVGPSVPAASVVLRGVPGNSQCLSRDAYSGSFAVLRLAEPLSFSSLRNVTQVELLMDEPEFVQFGRYTGKTSLVSCRLSESSLCGYPQVSCGVSAIKVEP